MSISTRGTHILYNCFRATCKRSGILKVNPLNDTSTPLPPKPKPEDTLSKSKVRALSDAKCMYFLTVYDIDDELTKKWFWNPSSRRVIIPLKNYKAETIGTMERYFPLLDPDYNEKDNQIKSMTKWNHEGKKEAHVHFPYPVTAPYELVLVEDVLSAIRLSNQTGAASAALLGTHITEAL